MCNVLFKYKDFEINDFSPTILCGIINVTPDSFSDGGKYNTVDSALARALEMVKDGAGMLDIGGESTRPGSTPVDIKEEIARVVPVIKAIKQHPELQSVIISVDTWKAEVAEAAVRAGADIINDITGLLGSENMAKVIAENDCGLIAMFNPVIMRPQFETSRNFPKFGTGNAFSDEEQKELADMDIVEAMLEYFKKVIAIANENGIKKERIMLDAGIGFGLTKKENLKLIQNLELIHALGYSSFLGVSRKRFIVDILQNNGFPADKNTTEGLEAIDDASAFLTAIAAYRAVNVLRVHDIAKHKMATLVADSVRLADFTEDTKFKAYKN